MRPFLVLLLANVCAWGAGPANYQPTQAEVRYGKFDRNTVDFFRAETKDPAPVLIYFHGGGWTGGDKKSFNPAPVLRAGIAVVTANYRFTTGTPDAAPFPAPMLDGARVVQFVRSKAEEWHIDPRRIALTGSSAGAVSAMWIGYHEDLARPDAADPVERFPTKVTCLIPQIGPTTLDPKIILQRVGGSPTIHPAMLPFFNVKSIGELETPEKRKLIEEASPITHVTKHSPPTFMQYASPLGGTPFPPNTSPNITIHHPEFGVMLKDKLDALGVENVLQTKGDGSDPNAMWTFLSRHLKPEGKPPGQ